MSSSREEGDASDTAFPTFNQLVADAIRERTKVSPYAKLLGIEVVEVKPGSIRCKMPIKDDLNSGIGIVHGGAVVSLVDHALSLVVYPLVEIGKWVATLEFKINYLSPVRLEPGSDIVADARVLALKKRVAAVRIDVTLKDQLVASAQGTGYIREKLG